MDIIQELYDKIIQSVKSGNKSFIFWGFNDNCIDLINILIKQGLSNYITAIIDDNHKGKKLFQYQILSSKSINKIKMDVLVITNDENKEEILKQFSLITKKNPDIIMAGNKHLEFKDPDFYKIYHSCLVKSYANGYKNSLIHLYQSIQYLAMNNISGSVIELGVFKGGTLVFIAKTLQHFGIKTDIYGFDIFNEKSKYKTGLDLYKHPRAQFDDYKIVENYCLQYNIKIIKGDICKTYKMLKNIPLALSFIDTDNYSPTKAALETIYNSTVNGGIITFDHFVSDPEFLSTIGERIAIKEVFKNKKVFNLYDTGVFIKC